MKNIRFLSRTNSLQGMSNIRTELQTRGVNTKRLRIPSSRYTPSDNTLIINWGGISDLPTWYTETSEDRPYLMLNKQSAITIAKNKLKTFNKLQTTIGLAQVIPEYTSSQELANRWVLEGHTVYTRELLEGNSGRGITVCNLGNGNPIPDVPLYTKGKNTRHEYRVHVVRGSSLLQRKALLSEDSNRVHSAIRNLDNGYHFINEFTLSDSLRELVEAVAKRAVKSLGLDFGAVDLITTNDSIYILEINTAVGATAPTVINFYTTEFMEIAGNSSNTGGLMT